MSAYEYELLGELEGEFELEGELEGEFEHELEWELEGELEGEQFLPLLGLAGKALASPTVRRLGLRAAKSALGGLGGLFREGEYELEHELEMEWEYELNPVRRVYADAMMEHLGHVAAEAETEVGEQFLPFLLPLAMKALPLAAKALPMAAKLLPKAASVISKFGPKLGKGLTNVYRTLSTNPSTKPLVRALPTIARRTVGNIASQVARGQPISAQSAVRALARNTARVLSNPQQAQAALRRSRMMDQRYHRLTRRSAGGGMASGHGCTCR